MIALEIRTFLFFSFSIFCLFLFLLTSLLSFTFLVSTSLCLGKGEKLGVKKYIFRYYYVLTEKSVALVGFSHSL